MPCTLTLAFVIVAAALAGLNYRGEIRAFHRTHPRRAAAVLAVFLAVAVITRTHAIVPIPSCMSSVIAQECNGNRECIEDRGWWCWLLDWLY